MDVFDHRTIVLRDTMCFYVFLIAFMLCEMSLSCFMYACTLSEMTKLNCDNIYIYIYIHVYIIQRDVTQAYRVCVIRKTNDVVRCHPDDIRYHHMSSGWLSWSRHLTRHPDELRQCYYVIRMTYTSILLSHMSHCFDGWGLCLWIALGQFRFGNIHFPFMRWMTSQYVFWPRDVIM